MAILYHNSKKKAIKIIINGFCQHVLCHHVKAGRKPNRNMAAFYFVTDINDKSYIQHPKKVITSQFYVLENPMMANSSWI